VTSPGDGPPEALGSLASDPDAQKAVEAGTGGEDAESDRLTVLDPSPPQVMDDIGEAPTEAASGAAPAVSRDSAPSADLETLDHTLDEMSPQPALAADIECPHCRLGQQAALDPYAWVVRDTGGLDQEVHTLALHYHWSEREILQLPRFRRARYLQLIDRSLGKYRADDLIRDAAGGAW